MHSSWYWWNPSTMHSILHTQAVAEHLDMSTSSSLYLFGILQHFKCARSLTRGTCLIVRVECKKPVVMFVSSQHQSRGTACFSSLMFLIVFTLRILTSDHGRNDIEKASWDSFLFFGHSSSTLVVYPTLKQHFNVCWMIFDPDGSGLVYFDDVLVFSTVALAHILSLAHVLEDLLQETSK